MAEQQHTTGTEVPAGGHEGKGAFPPFASETFASQLLWFALAFGLLYYLMSKIALPRVAAILEQRRNTIASDLEAAQRMKAESDAAVAAYEKSLAEARAAAQKIAGDTRDAVSAETETTRKGIEADLARKLADAEAQITATKAKAMENVRGIAADTASTIVEALTGKAPSTAAVNAAVEAAAKQGA
jgi:F-type H+-transporting ATPase subunit b